MLILGVLVKVVGSTVDKEDHNFLEKLLVVQGNDQSSQQSAIMRVSGESDQPVWQGRGLRVKVNFPIFKDEKTKDAVIYCLWWWGVATFVAWVGMTSICCHMSSGHCRGSWETWPGV